MTTMNAQNKKLEGRNDIVSKAVKKLSSYPATPHEISKKVCAEDNCDAFLAALVIKDAFEEMRQLDLIQGNFYIGYYISDGS